MAVPADHQLTAAFATLDAVAASSAATLPNGDSQPFGLSWQGLIEQPDRAAALRVLRIRLAAGQPKFIAIDRDCAGFDSLGQCRKPTGQACFEALQIFIWASRQIEIADEAPA